MRRLLPILILLSSASLQFGCDGDRPASVFGGPDGFRRLQDATSAVAFRINPYDKDNHPIGGNLTAFPTTSPPISIDATTLEQLKSLLKSPDSYLWDVAKPCAITPGIRLSFTSDHGSLDLFICYECKILVAYVNDHSVGGEDFDPIEEDLIEIAKSLFPNDSQIQTLD